MRLLTPLCALLLVLSAAVARGDTVTVFAAASLKGGLDEVGRAYQASSGHQVVVSYGSSSSLAKQIENGAPAEVFLSADVDWMDYLAARSLIAPKSRVNLLANRLVLIAPAGSAAALNIKPGFALAAALGAERLAMGDPDHVPAGKYAKAALESLGVWSGVEKKLARAENVRAALALVARGEVPFGIVYRTDALAERKVRIVAEFPSGTHPAIVYPAALTVSAKGAAPAGLLAFLASPAARAIWRQHGFGEAY